MGQTESRHVLDCVPFYQRFDMNCWHEIFRYCELLDRKTLYILLMLNSHRVNNEYVTSTLMSMRNQIMATDPDHWCQYACRTGDAELLKALLDPLKAHSKRYISVDYMIDELFTLSVDCGHEKCTLILIDKFPRAIRPIEHLYGVCRSHFEQTPQILSNYLSPDLVKIKQSDRYGYERWVQQIENLITEMIKTDQIGLVRLLVVAFCQSIGTRLIQISSTSICDTQIITRIIDFSLKHDMGDLLTVLLNHRPLLAIVLIT